MAEEIEGKGEDSLPSDFHVATEESNLCQKKPLRKTGDARASEESRSQDEELRGSKQRKIAKEAAAQGSKQQREEQVGQSITSSEVESLIQGALEAATAAQGEGEQFDRTPSQCWLRVVQSLAVDCFKGSEDHVPFATVCKTVVGMLEVLQEVDQRRPQTMVGDKELFPLPIPNMLDDPTSSTGTLRALVASLNSLYGVDVSSCPRRTALRDRIVKRLTDVVGRVALDHLGIPTISFDEFFLHRGVDYMGEEIKLARSVTWEGIEPSLPDQVGSLDIRDYCDQGVLHYINNFEHYLVPPELRVVGKTPRVMCDESEWPRVVRGLVQRGLCQVVGLKDLAHFGGRPLLNGMFAVSKQEYVGTTELCRLIMNLKPLNANCRALEADTGTLPSITQLGSCYLDEGEVLCMSSEDLRCYFYLFSVPQAWVRYMGFGKPIPPGTLGPEGVDDEPQFLAARVLPMGFLNSVGIAQHIHRRVVRHCYGNLHSLGGGELELRRDRVGSSGARLFRVYLDNYDQLCRVDRRLAEIIRGTPSPEVEALRACYAQQGLPTHPKKSVQQELGAEIQGAWVDGEMGTCMAKPQKVARYIGLIFALLREGKASQKELQIVGGGMVYISMFKGQILGGLNQIWRDIVAFEGK